MELKKRLKQNKKPLKNLILDVPHRWGSFFKMIERFNQLETFVQ